MSDEVKRSDLVRFDPSQVAGLNSQQVTALEALFAGMSVTESAQLAGVARSTMYLWFNDPEFKMAYQQWREEIVDTCRSRLLMMTDKALVAVEKQLESGDGHAGLRLLKGLGALERPEEKRRRGRQ